MAAAACQLPGLPGMYGLGIRIAVYTQWLGAVLMSHIDESSLPNVRILGLLLSASIALSLVLHIADRALQAADIYITLLLGTGIYLPLVPVYLVRGLTLWHPRWDPLCWSTEKSAPAVAIGNFSLLLSMASVGLWFHATFLPAASRGDCVQYAFFLFFKLSLYHEASVAFHVILYLCMILVCAEIIMRKAGFRVKNWRQARRRFRRARSSR